MNPSTSVKQLYSRPFGLNRGTGNHDGRQLEELRSLIDKLDVTDVEYMDDMELKSVKEKIVSLIRKNREVQSKIDEADRRIGSLVRNIQLITSQDLMKSYLKSLNSSSEPSSYNENNSPHHHLFEFSAEGKTKQRTYEKLLYTLQTHPQYLAKLLVHDRIPTKNSWIMPLFSFVFTPRDDYLLLKVLDAALTEEVHNVLYEAEDIIRDNGCVMIRAIDVYRSDRVSSPLHSLSPLLEGLINGPQSILSIDPVYIYKQYFIERSGRGSSSSKESSVPTNLTREEALRHPEVVKRLQLAVDNLLRETRKFVEVITTEEFINEIPYGLRYLTRRLWELLVERFPSTSKRTLLKIVANVLYYRFIGSCISAPDAFGLVKLRAGQRLSHEVRNNLGNIGKLLTAASMGQKKFPLPEIDFYQSLSLNTFLTESYDRFVDFFRSALIIEPPEDYFEVNEFMDDVLLTPLEVTLKMSELIVIHSEIYRARNLLAPLPSDGLNEILDILGPPPKSVKELMAVGKAVNSKSDKKTKRQSFVEEDYSQNQVTFKLRNNGSVPLKSTDTAFLKAVKVKQAIVELIKHRRKCKDLNEVFFKPVDEEESHEYELTKNHLKETTTLQFRSQSVLFSTHGETLNSLVDYVRVNLKAVNAGNFDDICQQLKSDMQNKIDNQEKIRREIDRLKGTLEVLKEKREYTESILTYYKEYITTCLDNMKSMSSVRGIHFTKTKQSAVSSSKNRNVKYTASKLLKKGILTELKGVMDDKWKDVVFDITPLPHETGLFLIVLRFQNNMELERVKIELQYLLELQYKGVKQLNLTERSKVDVKGMIYFLNKKFYRAWS